MTMYDQLKSRVAELLKRPRPLKPQTERQLAAHMSEHTAGVWSFLRCAAEVLEEYELDILFGPQFTPTLDDQASLADLLYHWRPSDADLRRLVDELCNETPHAIVLLPDETEAELTLHEVMVDRFVRLLRLGGGPSAATAATLREALPQGLWPIAIALSCQRGFDEQRQRWFAAFVTHMASRHPIDRGLLETAAEFIARQQSLEHGDLVKAAEALVRASEGTAAFTSSGHNYWSTDVAQHHHYRGQGNIDKERLQQRQAELAWAQTMTEDLRCFDTDAARGD